MVDSFSDYWTDAAPKTFLCALRESLPRLSDTVAMRHKQVKEPSENEILCTRATDNEIL